MKTITYENISESGLAAVRTRAFEAIASGFSVLKARASASLQSVQTARMISALQGMSNEQLEQIGVKRADIPAYAHQLVVEEN
ncbi:DUF1127 domain-containing protein [Neptunicoccus cionae]|uniref:DUF1127 domain-containing protein n=1 Tax=Neptunicoccus cionae TaxID=2035344 RepID=UPI000C776201|nr:DUF1127 domain-containing protein [Amylibacter cionae]PLS23325.1 hypothetical protein C0U40_04140 [Amylibacter cionae]